MSKLYIPKILAGVCFSLMNLKAADFLLKEHLGHQWSNEVISFPLTQPQAQKAQQEKVLIDNDGERVAYQIAGNKEGKKVFIQVDLEPLETRRFHFSEKTGTANTDLWVKESKERIELGNNLIGVSIRRNLNGDQGPIEKIRLRSGEWTGGSVLASDVKLSSYTADVSHSGAVFVEVQCQAKFEDGGRWSASFRVENGEPVVVVNEAFDVPGGGTFTVQLGDHHFQPKDVFFRGGAGGMLAKIGTEPIEENPVYILEPWLHWWGAERQGNWFALYTNTQKEELNPTKGLGKKEPKKVESLVDELDANKVKKITPDPHPDMLMIGALRPSIWKDPDWKGTAKHVSTTIAAKLVDGNVVVPFKLGGGKRKWMIGTPDKSTSIAGLAEKNRRLSPRPQRLLIKHGDFPLNEVKNFVLEWKGDHSIYPNLFMGKEDIARWKKASKVPPAQISKWERGYQISGYNFGETVATYWSSGSTKIGQRMLETIDKMLHKESIDAFLTQEHRAAIGVAPHQQANTLVAALNFADACFSVPEMSPEMRKKLLAQIAFIGYAVTKEDYWSERRGFSANPNMTTTVAQFQVTAACLIPSHPMAQSWADKGMGTLRYQLNAWSDEDGGWLEAPHYAMVAYDHILGAFLMAARAGFGDYVYHDRMKKVGEWFGKISTPRDHHTGNHRHYPPIGNTYHGEGTGMFGILATIWKDRDPAFAANMQWICEEHGSPGIGIGGLFPGLIGYKKLLMENDVEPKKPDWGSELFKETGVVMRNRMMDARETYLHMIAGKNHEHYDYDSGSIVLWGKGSVLVDDWGYIGRHAPEYHSMIVSPETKTGGVMNITEFSTQPDFDYVTGTKGAWQRQIAFVKDKDPSGPNYFVIRDTHHADIPSTWRLWLTTKPEEQSLKSPSLEQTGKKKDTSLLDDLLSEEKNSLARKKENTPPVKIHKDGATVSGEKDVDFDLFIYRPERLGLKADKVTQRMAMSQRDGKQGANYLTQTALIGSLTNQGSIITLVYPRLKGEPSPKVTWHADGHIAAVQTTSGTDYVFLATDTETSFKTKSGIVFQGTAGAILEHAQHRVLVTGASGKVTKRKATLASQMAATKPIRN